ncbi:hypothetical protein EJ03DRAFT_57767 [Teratosphaeria nubilosa]|uniref:Uncharacterized protein n=1 Tax=Teratosphaeria nubilosa TaxID=161662 RepID=A0A6G1KSZ5_9PEZI|nr:hypothetical protein EJ03DRAFT_57767 [Teratosphaeria nubilosa]
MFSTALNNAHNLRSTPSRAFVDSNASMAQEYSKDQYQSLLSTGGETHFKDTSATSRHVDEETLRCRGEPHENEVVNGSHGCLWPLWKERNPRQADNAIDQPVLSARYLEQSLPSTSHRRQQVTAAKQSPSLSSRRRQPGCRQPECHQRADAVKW